MSHPAPAHCDSKQAASASILSPISLAKQQQQRREGRQQECTTGSVDAEPAEDMEGPLLTDCSEPADESDGEVTVQLDSEEEAAGDGEADADDGLARGHTSMLVPASLPRRTPSLLSSFAQSPLSLSSFPPFGSRQKSQLRNEEESRTPPSSSHPDNAAVLASRLRQERNEAIASLAYCALENDITVKTLESELQELRSGRDNLRQDLQEMVSKLIEGERAQNQLEQVTDTLCQTESSFQQVKGRLETAYAELDDLRARLSESSIRQTTNSPVLASETCTCRSDSDSLRHTIATLEDELDSARRQHLGSTNLVLSLRNDLDQKHRECEAARADSETQTQQIKELQRLLEATKRQAGETQQELQAERKATQNADRVHIERTEEIKETLKEVQLQLQGAVNRALVLQNHLDERQADIAALEIEKEGSESRMAAMQEEILSQSEKTAFASARAETLQAEIYSLQRSVEHMVLLQLQSKRTITAQAYRLRRRASEAPDGRPDNQDPSDLGLMVLLIEASRQLRTLKRRHDAAKQRNVELVERAEALAVENQALSTYTVDNNNQASTIDTLLADKADLQKQLATMRVDRDSIRQELQSAKNLAETSSNIVQTVEANLKDTSTALMTAKTELRESHNIIAGLKQELANARESLRVAEEEGRNLVADFNLLSEELESRQQEDETRSAHTADTERRLAEANAKEEAMRAQRSLDEAALAELTERLQALENDLEQMQISVDETDDKYLQALKTIKKQSVQLDKSKIRNEALVRANAILSRAVPATENSPMAPAQASAKKRTLPREFVAPDPGPMAVLSVPRSDWDRHPLENMPPDSVTEPETRKAEAATVPDKAQQFPSILKTENRPANPKSDTENGREAKPHKHALISTSKIGAMGPHRAPLAPLTGQRSLQQAPADSSEKSASKVCTTASASLSSRVPFKPSSALNGKTQSRPPASSDTRSLLAALHALKRPA